MERINGCYWKWKPNSCRFKVIVILRTLPFEFKWFYASNKLQWKYGTSVSPRGLAVSHKQQRGSHSSWRNRSIQSWRTRYSYCSQSYQTSRKVKICHDSILIQTVKSISKLIWINFSDSFCLTDLEATAR